MCNKARVRSYRTVLPTHAFLIAMQTPPKIGIHELLVPGHVVPVRTIRLFDTPERSENNKSAKETQTNDDDYKESIKLLLQLYSFHFEMQDEMQNLQVEFSSLSKKFVHQVQFVENVITLFIFVGMILCCYYL